MAYKEVMARNIKHKLSVWVNKEERLRESEHEEEVHVMCEPEQGEYLDEEEENDDIAFTDKIMDMEKSSYQYKKKKGVLM